MSKGKKIYCVASFVFACMVLIVTIALCVTHPTTTYAASTNSSSSTTGSTEVANHNDQTDGLSITYNNENGSLSTPVRMLLVLTVLSLAPSILIMMTSFLMLVMARLSVNSSRSPTNLLLRILWKPQMMIVMNIVLPKMVRYSCWARLTSRKKRKRTQANPRK